MILEVGANKEDAKLLPQVDLAKHGILERKHLQKWIGKNSSVLGEELMIIDEEFDEVTGARDRVDLLAIDEDSRLVIVELKRTPFSDHGDLQAVRYAAKLRSATTEDAVNILEKSITKMGVPSDAVDALQEIEEFLELEGEPFVLAGEPRIILAAPGFSNDLLTTVTFLIDHGIEIACVKLGVYQTENGSYVVVPDRLLPLPEAEEFTEKIQIRPRKAEPAARRAPKSFPFLVAAGVLKEGQQLHLKHNLPKDVGQQYRADDPRFRAKVAKKVDAPPKLVWEVDGKEYSPTELAKNVFATVTGGKNTPTAASGPYHWGTEDSSLKELSDKHRRDAAVSGRVLATVDDHE